MLELAISMSTKVTDAESLIDSDYLITALSPIYQSLVSFTQRQKGKDIDEQIVEVSSQLEAISASAAKVPHLEKLCTIFELSSFERDVLLLCICRAVFPDVPYLLSLAHRSNEFDFVTFGLALRLFENTHWQAILPRSPLRYWQLLVVGTKLDDVTLAPLRIDEAILHYLMEEDYYDPYLEGIVEPLTVSQPNLPSSHEEIAKSVTKVWSNLSGGDTVPVMQLCGDSISASQEIAQAVCDEHNFVLYSIESDSLPSNGDEFSFFLQRWHRQARLVGSVLLLNCYGVSREDRVRQEAISRLVKKVKTPLLVCSQMRTSFGSEAIIFDVPTLTHGEQLAMWQASLGEVSTLLNGTVESLVTSFNLSGATIQNACSTVVSQTEEQQPTPLAEKLWSFCRSQARPQLDNLAQRMPSEAGWDDLVVPQKVKRLLRELVTQVQQRATVYQQWGLAKGSRRGLGVSALFAGESGTGKTLAAEVLANQFALDLYRIDLSQVVSKYIGETEKNLERIFSAAEGGGVVLLFDEADALFGKRTDVKDSHDRHANVEVSFLLQRMEAYQGLAILTTNLKDSLDRAFLRRLRFIVDFPFPDAQSRSEIWRRMYPQQTPTRELDYRRLGQLAMTGGNIRNIALNAAFLAAESERVVMMRHILAAAKAEAMKLERSLSERETLGWISLR